MAQVAEMAQDAVMDQRWVRGLIAVLMRRDDRRTDRDREDVTSGRSHAMLLLVRPLLGHRSFPIVHKAQARPEPLREGVLEGRHEKAAPEERARDRDLAATPVSDRSSHIPMVDRRSRIGEASGHRRGWLLAEIQRFARSLRRRRPHRDQITHRDDLRSACRGRLGTLATGLVVRLIYRDERAMQHCRARHHRVMPGLGSECNGPRCRICRLRSGRRLPVHRGQVPAARAPTLDRRGRRHPACRGRAAMTHGRVSRRRSGRLPSSPRAEWNVPGQALAESVVRLALVARSLRCRPRVGRAAPCHRSLGPVAVGVATEQQDVPAVAGEATVKKAAVEDVGAANGRLRKPAEFSDWIDSAACGGSINRLRMRCVPAPCLS